MNKKLKTAMKIGGVYVLCDLVFQFGKAWAIASLKSNHSDVMEQCIESLLNEDILKEFSIPTRMNCKFIGKCAKLLSNLENES